MDITSTAASTIQVNQKPTTTKPDSLGKQPPTPEDANLKAIQTEIKQITDEMKDSKLQPLKQDTANFAKSEKAEEINMTTPASPLEAKPDNSEKPIKENTPAA